MTRTAGGGTVAGRGLIRRVDLAGRTRVYAVTGHDTADVLVVAVEFTPRPCPPRTSPHPVRPRLGPAHHQPAVSQ